MKKTEEKPSPEKTGAAGAPTQDQLTLLAGEPAHASHLGPRLRGYFLTGLIIVGPVAITLYVVWWFINLVDAWVKPLIPRTYLPETYLPFNVPGVGLIVGILGLMLVGALTANLFGRTIVGSWRDDARPHAGRARRLPSVQADLHHHLFQQRKLVQARRADRVSAQGLYCVVFCPAIRPPRSRTRSATAKPLMTVFMPNGPNPTTGFIVFMPAKDVILLDMAIEDGAKLVVSAGLVGPPARWRCRRSPKAKAAKARRPRKSRWSSAWNHLSGHRRDPARISLIASSRSKR